ncbi:hypothetical protein PHMEG_00026557 [Phytophthora megakarya]|uniref:Uncharacterized protein n=1 Tax=Phytophthora megakarya TaxID=4795 RepID=A0A225V9F4_9STRA|nr:hypothetical protein PHMEG_00026557 [Phytophthora megakarya]
MRCHEQQLYVKLSKCKFCDEEIPWLDELVGRNGVRIDPDKVCVIKEWSVPRTKKQMGRFWVRHCMSLGFGVDFAQFASPLHESIKRLRLKKPCILPIINLIKRRLSTPPVFQLPDFNKPFGIRMEASNFAIGGVLFQNEGGLEHPIAYTSRKMKLAELNYPVREQELLATMHALRTILTQKTTNRRVARWFNELAECHPQFKWIAGDNNQVSNAVSHNPLFEHKAAQVSLSELIEAARNKEIVASIQTTSVTVAHSAKQLYSTDIRVQEILQMLDVQKKYCWPKMPKYIQRYVNTCELSQRNKARQTKPPGLLQPLEIPEGRWVDIPMDVMTSLP